MKKIPVLLPIIILCQAGLLLGVQPETMPAGCCADMQFLLGEWEAAGSGEIGSSSGVMSFVSDLGGHVMIRRNRSRGKQGAHEDLMIIYRDSAGTLRADYFDSEGHVIAYNVSVTASPQSAVFTHRSTDKEPGFRFAHIAREDGTLDLVFEIAPPGSSEFKPYLKGTARRSR
jgi:hypothetical protein